MADIVVRYLHFLAILSMFALLYSQYLLLRGPLEKKWFKPLATINLAYGLSALLAMVSGIGLWFFVGKSANFYANNWALLSKVLLFIAVALTAIAPSLYINRLKNSPKTTVDVPKSITRCLCFELLLLGTMPLLAGIVAYGSGYL